MPPAFGRLILVPEVCQVQGMGSEGNRSTCIRKALSAGFSDQKDQSGYEACPARASLVFSNSISLLCRVITHPH